ncbi:MAG: hypothetical protein JXX28_13705 [Deltaproteobacteria bacterium]|nr:hypothetical protein [Deltaproteobacteria bacterium]
MSLLLLLPTLALADWPPGATIDPAVSVDVTEEGLNALLEVVPAFLPERLPLDDIYGDGAVYRYWVHNMWVGMAMQDGTLSPDLDTLHLDLSLNVWMNDASDPFVVEVDAYTFWWWTLADCDVHIDPFPVEVLADIELRMDHTVTPARLDAEITLLQSVQVGLNRDQVAMDCWVGTLDDVMDWVGLSPVDMAIDFALDEVNAQIVDMLDQLELTIEDSFNGLAIDQTLDLQGVPLQMRLNPSDVRIRPDGVRVAMAGSFDAPPDACVADYQVSQSHATQGTAPAIGSAPPDLEVSPHHIGAFIDDDWINQALYATWRGGLLCQDLSAEDGLPLSTALLASLSEDYQEIFPDASGDLELVTRPAAPPLVHAVGGHDVNLSVDKLGVDFMADLDYRRTRVVGADLDLEAGVDLLLDAPTGNLDVVVDLSAEGLTTVIVHNELLPGQDEALADHFDSLFDTVVLPMLGSYTDSLSFAIPSISGVGLTSLELRPAGTENDHFGAYANIGPVPYGEGAGCNSTDGGGCGGGCGHGGPLPASGLLGLATLAGAALRRRRSA